MADIRSMLHVATYKCALSYGGMFKTQIAVHCVHNLANKQSTNIPECLYF